MSIEKHGVHGVHRHGHFSSHHDFHPTFRPIPHPFIPHYIPLYHPQSVRSFDVPKMGPSNNSIDISIDISIGIGISISISISVYKMFRLRPSVSRVRSDLILSKRNTPPAGL